MLLKNDLREMTSRWSGSYIGVDVDGSVIPFYVAEFQQSKDINVPDLHGNFIGGKLEVIPAKNLVFKQPKFGMINHGDSVFYTSLIPARQYRRGITANTVKIENTFAKEFKIIRKPNPKALFNDVNFLKELFNPQYPSVHESIAMVRGFVKLASAFNHKYAIGITAGAKSPRVYYKGLNIGWLDKRDNVYLRSSSAHLFEELSQYLQCTVMEK